MGEKFLKEHFAPLRPEVGPSLSTTRSTCEQKNEPDGAGLYGFKFCSLFDTCKDITEHKSALFKLSWCLHSAQCRSAVARRRLARRAKDGETMGCGGCFRRRDRGERLCGAPIPPLTPVRSATTACLSASFLAGRCRCPRGPGRLWSGAIASSAASKAPSVRVDVCCVPKDRGTNVGPPPAAHP